MSSPLDGPHCGFPSRAKAAILLGALALSLPVVAAAAGLEPADFLRLRSVTDVQVSPDGTRVAYVVERNDGPGRPTGQVFVLTLADGQSVRFGGETDSSGSPLWSPDGRWIAFRGTVEAKEGLVLARPDGSGLRFLAEMRGTNTPLPGIGRNMAWSPDGRQIAFVSAVPGPETAEAEGDPMVITRYLYKPEYDEGLTRFGDNRRLHIFAVTLETGAVRSLTTGVHQDHSIDWSPNGEEILFLSSREADEDEFFNYDVFALRAKDGQVRRVTATESNEYRPRWSPDGKKVAFQATKRGLTDRETTMEDTHVYVMDADGSGRREVGAPIDNRQGAPAWAPDGASLYFTVQERGRMRLVRVPASGGSPDVVVDDRGTVGAFSVGLRGTLAYAFASASDLAQLYWRPAAAPGRRAAESPPRKLTDLNTAVLQGKELAPVESFTFVSNDNVYEVEAFLTRPLGMTADSKHPLVVNIHGGPHGQQGPAFNFKNQVYAARGWATLMVNYRGSTGYGQKFADAVFGDQNGNEGHDVLYGLSAAIRRNLWIDRDRLGVEGGSYGGQLSCWLITQTSVFKAAIPTAPITNLISYNYMTYYNQYEEMEFGKRPHQGNLMDVLWERSALKHVAKARTPTLLIHGENDNDVPIAESEQFYIALRDVGVPAVMVRYPREGHGLREPRHVQDALERSIRWYERYFPPRS